MSEKQYEGAPASPAVQVMCKMFVEKTNREQQEIVQAALATDADKANAGFQLDIQRGIWVREIPQAPAPIAVKTELPALKVLQREGHEADENK